MKRHLIVTLELEIEDDAIICRDDPEFYNSQVAEVGDRKFVEAYVYDNFREAIWLRANAQQARGALENIRAYATLKTINVLTHKH